MARNRNAKARLNRKKGSALSRIRKSARRVTTRSRGAKSNAGRKIGTKKPSANKPKTNRSKPSPKPNRSRTALDRRTSTAQKPSKPGAGRKGILRSLQSRVKRTINTTVRQTQRKASSATGKQSRGKSISAVRNRVNKIVGSVSRSIGTVRAASGRGRASATKRVGTGAASARQGVASVFNRSVAKLRQGQGALSRAVRGVKLPRAPSVNLRGVRKTVVGAQRRLTRAVRGAVGLPTRFGRTAGRAVRGPVEAVRDALTPVLAPVGRIMDPIMRPVTAVVGEPETPANKGLLYGGMALAGYIVYTKVA